jgi:hypothetical protein
MRFYNQQYLLALALMLFSGSSLTALEKIAPGFSTETEVRKGIEKGDLKEVDSLIAKYAFSPKELGEFCLSLLSSEELPKQEILSYISILKTEGAELRVDTEMSLNWEVFIDKGDQDLFEALQGIKGSREFLQGVYLNAKCIPEFFLAHPILGSIEYLANGRDLFEKIGAFLIQKEVFFSKKEMALFIEENYQLWPEHPTFLVSDMLEHVSPKITAELFYRYMCRCPGLMLNLLDTGEAEKYWMLIAPYFSGKLPKYVSPKELLLWIIEDMEKADDMSGFYIPEENMGQVGQTGGYYFVLQSAGMKAYLDKEFETLDDRLKQKVLEINCFADNEGIDKELQQLFDVLEKAYNSTKEGK